jgi:hypothetical protein
MNRGLLIFAILLILTGAFLNEYFISIFGFFLLFPAILSSRRPRQSRPPVSKEPQSRRVIPKPPPVYEPQPPVQTPVLTPPPPAQVKQPQPTYSAALFPNVMFPSLSTALPSIQRPKESAEQSSTQRDELLEVGALLTLLRLVLG